MTDNKVYTRGHEGAEKGITNARTLSELNYFISILTSPPGLNHCPKSLSKFRSGSGLRNVCSRSMSHAKSPKPGMAVCGRSIRLEAGSALREGGALGVAGAGFVCGP